LAPDGGGQPPDAATRDQHLYVFHSFVPPIPISVPYDLHIVLDYLFRLRSARTFRFEPHRPLRQDSTNCREIVVKWDMIFQKNRKKLKKHKWTPEEKRS
jgi:hypothetical protein